VDRAALDAAMELGIPCGGWCPKGRKAEDGVIPAKYPLVETASAAYRVRTARNARDSDATLILTRGRPRGGTKLTVKYAEARGKPLLVVDLSECPDITTAVAWIVAHQPRVLNVAGPRESQAPGIYEESRRFLLDLLAGRETHASGSVVEPSSKGATPSK
jgi:hypothetical protein